MRTGLRYFRDNNGAGAAEFALVVVPFIGLVLGIIGLSMALYANQTLQFATEAAARYYSVQAAIGNNPSTTTITNYASTHYKGPSITPSFVANAAASCGHQVTGTGTLPLNTGLVNTSVTLHSSACFP